MEKLPLATLRFLGHDIRLLPQFLYPDLPHPRPLGPLTIIKRPQSLHKAPVIATNIRAGVILRYLYINVPA